MSVLDHSGQLCRDGGNQRKNYPVISDGCLLDLRPNTTDRPDNAVVGHHGIEGLEAEAHQPKARSPWSPFQRYAATQALAGQKLKGTAHAFNENCAIVHASPSRFSQQACRQSVVYHLPSQRWTIAQSVEPARRAVRAVHVVECPAKSDAGSFIADVTAESASVIT